MAEHMLILKLTSPDGRVKLPDRRLPQRRAGKTNLGDAHPTLETGTVENDRPTTIAWMKFGATGACTRSTPRPAFFRRGPETTKSEDQPQCEWRPSAPTRSSPTRRRTDDGRRVVGGA